MSTKKNVDLKHDHWNSGIFKGNAFIHTVLKTFTYIEG